MGIALVPPWYGLRKDKTPKHKVLGGFDGFNNSLTMTYFHTGTRTIIGAKSFHCPVRDGKEWYQLAMVIRLKLCAALLYGQCS